MSKPRTLFDSLSFDGVFSEGNNKADASLLREELIVKKAAVQKIVAVMLAIACVFCVVNPTLAETAADLTVKGAKIFSANCAACHQGGNNVVAANKNLKSAALKQYGMDSTDAIITQVTNGKGAMPSFRGRLKEEDVKAVAAYVLDQSAKDWKK